MIVKWTKITILKVYFINRKHNRNLFLAFYWHDDDPPSCKDNYLKLWFGIVRNQPTYHSQYDFYKRNYDHNVYNRAIRVLKQNYYKNEKIFFMKSFILLQHFCTTNQKCVGTPSICRSYQTNYSWIRISNYNTNIMVQLITFFDVLPRVYEKLCGENNVTS